MEMKVVSSEINQEELQSCDQQGRLRGPKRPEFHSTFQIIFAIISFSLCHLKIF